MDYISYSINRHNLCIHLNHIHAHTVSDYRKLIVLVSLVAGSMGMVAVILMKVRELWQSKMNSTPPETETQTTFTETHYGTIQKGRAYHVLH